jgi:hypothetical protein
VRRPGSKDHKESFQLFGCFRDLKQQLFGIFRGLKYGRTILEFSGGLKQPKFNKAKTSMRAEVFNRKLAY